MTIRTTAILFTLALTSFIAGCGGGNQTSQDSKLEQMEAACTSAGGSCVAITPTACQGGHFAEPAACGGGVGVGCCLPGPASSDANSAPANADSVPVAEPPANVDTAPVVGPPADGDSAPVIDPPATGGDAPVDGPNACAQAGGTCVGVYPGACPSGHFGAPSSCGDAVGASCCLP